MSTNDLYDFLRRETNTLAEEYDRIQKRVHEDPGTAGDQAEENWATILRVWLPSYYRIVTKGRVLGTDGMASPQIDLLVLSPAYPQTLLDKKLYLAGGVVAAFECKTTLRSKHIQEFFENCLSIRTVAPNSKGTPFKELRPPIIYGLLAHSHEWKFEASKPTDNVSSLLRKCDADIIKHPSQAPDLVCVADIGVWNTMRGIFQETAPSGANGSIVRSGYAAHLVGSELQTLPFTPVGSLLTMLYQKLGWTDLQMRNLEEYFRKTTLGGGMGFTRAWPLDILSIELRTSMTRRPLSNGVMFDEWSMAFH